MIKRVKALEGEGLTGAEVVESIERIINAHADLIAALKEARIFAATVSQATGTAAGKQKELGVSWRSTQEWAASLEAMFSAALAKAGVK